MFNYLIIYKYIKMLKSIKSSYIIKIVLSFIKEKHKLKLVKYNKSLQNKIDISIINYIYFSVNI